MKSKRQEVLLRLIREQKIETQDELRAKLAENGYFVTQGTVSRDIREARIIKTAGEDGRSYYRQQLPAEQEPAVSDTFISILRKAARRVDAAGNLVVVKTFTGMGGAVGAAVDAMPQIDCVGTLAGDDTLLIIARDPEAASAICALLNRLLESDTD